MVSCERLEYRALLSVSTVSPWHATDPLAQPGQVSYLTATEYESYTLDIAAIQQSLSAAPDEFSGTSGVVIPLAAPTGQMELFSVYETSMMAPGLAAAFPEIQTYGGRSLTDPLATVKIDVSPGGFHAQVLRPGGSWYIDPLYHLNTSVYASYFTSAAQSSGTAARGSLPADIDGNFGSSAGDATSTTSYTTDTFSGGLSEGSWAVNRTSGTQLRKYRAAIAATGEYTAFHGGTVALGQAAIVTAINRLNGIYEKELSIRLELVANNSSLVYTNAATDPYTNNDFDALLDENQPNTDTVIGTANYDIGHVFCTGNGGLAVTPSVGVASVKAQGASGFPQPSGDIFVVNFVAHEVGHQFGAQHTFNSSSDPQRNPATAYEPGSGSTIMSYAGGLTAAENLQSDSDAYFHHNSFEAIINYVDVTRPTVGTRVATNNSIPTVTAGADFTIPTGTPFVLTASGSDANADDQLTYNWEQDDLGPAQLLTGAQNTTSPLFRSWLPTSDASRTFPRLTELVNNTTPKGERLPTVARTMKFRATVRDNRAGGGGVSSDDMSVSVVNTGSVFAVTAPNTAVVWTGNTSQTVTWAVAGTTTNGINTANVRIRLSTDGGLTYPTVLAESVSNNGSATVTVPNGINTTQARIRVEAVGNIFFDISNANFTVNPAAPEPEISVTVDNVPLNDGTGTVDFGAADHTFNNAGTISKVFTVTNTGTSPLSLQPISVTGTGFALTSDNFSPGQSLAVNSSVTFTVRMDTITAGNLSAAVSFGNTDSDENPFGFTVTGIVRAAAIQVLEGTTPLENLSTLDFGSVDEGSASQRTLTVKNNGAVPLVLNFAQLVDEFFSPTSDFSFVTGITPGQSIPVGGQFDIVVAMDTSVPTLGTPRSAMLLLSTNDPQFIPSFDLNLTGQVTEVIHDSGTSVIANVLSLELTVGESFTVDYSVQKSDSGNPAALAGTVRLFINGVERSSSTSMTSSFFVNGLDEGDYTVRISYSGNEDYFSSEGTQFITVRHQITTVSVSDVMITEGNAGTVNATFTVTLSASPTNLTSVDFATIDSTAMAGEDYTATSGTLTFSPGEFEKTVTVPVNGDTLSELDETFSVVISNPVNTTIDDDTGVGTITNDDVAPAAEISVLNGAAEIIDGATVPISLGTTTAGLVKSKNFTIRNIGSGPLSIEQITVPDGFTVVTPPPASIAPNGQFTLTVRLSALTVGTFSGTLSIASSDSDENPFDFAISGVVNKASVSTTLSSSANPAVFGQPIVLTATVARAAGTGVPTGTVTFSVDGVTQPPVSLVNGQATFSPAGLVTGDHTVTALYNGDANNNAGTATTLIGGQTVNQAATSVSLQSSVNPIQIGQTVTFTATVTSVAPGAAVPLGNVTFHVNGNPIGTIDLVNGVATVTTSNLPGGILPIRANFNGSSNFVASEVTLEQTVNLPEIEVQDASNTAVIEDGGKASLGTFMTSASPVLRTFSVFNRGLAPLILHPITVTGDGYSLSGANFADGEQLAPGASKSFVIRLNAGLPGFYTGSVSFGNSDNDEAPFDFGLETGVDGPGIAVSLDATSITDGTLTATEFGNVIQGSAAVQKTFKVTNSGNLDLKLKPLTLPAGFSIFGSNFTVDQIVRPGEFATIVIQLDSTVPGAKAGSISFGNNTATLNPFNFPIRGTVVVPEISVLNGNAAIVDGSTTAVSIGTVLRGTAAGISRTLTIKNTGTGNLVLQPATITANAGFTITTNFSPNQIVAPGASANLTVRLDAVTAGSKTADLSFANTDSDEGPFNFKVAGIVTDPEIQIADGLTDVLTGSTRDYGTLLQGGAAITKTFTIRNTGNGNLVLQPVSITANSGFTIKTNVTAGLILAPNATRTIVIQLDNLVAGNKTATLTIPSTDGNENPFTIKLTGKVTAPEISVLNGTATILDGSATAVSIGTVLTGTAAGISRTFTVKNTGTGNLILQPATITANAGFTITTNFLKNQVVLPGASASLVVRLDAVVPGAKTATLSLTNSDQNENPYNFPISGLVTAPEIQVLMGTTDIADGLTTPVDFGSVVQKAVGISKTFAVKNTGNGNLVLQPVVAPAGYTVTTNFTAGQIVLPGKTASLVVRLDSVVLGTKPAQISFTNSDASEGTFNFAITGKVVAPEIQVLNGTLDVADNTGVVAFGTVVQKAVGITRTLTIKNTGTSNLKLQPAAFTAGAGFTIVTNITASRIIAPGGSYNLVIRLDSLTLGAKTATISFVNDDGSENPFDIKLTGSVVAPEVQVLNGAVDLPNLTGTIDYGSVKVGTSISKTITVRNTGTSSLTIKKIVTVSSGWVVTTNLTLNQVILPGKTAAVTIRFDAAGAAGARTGTLQFGSDDGDEATFKLNLKAVVTVPAAQALIGVTVIADGATAPVAFGTTTQLKPVSKTFTIKNTGNAPLVVQPVAVPAGFTVTTNLVANKTIAPGATATFIVRLNATVPGTFSGQLTFATDDPARSIYNFVVTGTVVARTLDDGDSGFTATGTWTPGVSAGTATGRSGDQLTAPAGTGTSVARWTFTGLTAGTWRISATWLKQVGAATNAVFTISTVAGGPALATKTVNQSLAPGGRLDQGSIWTDLGDVVITGTTLVIELKNNANGSVLADAIRIEKIL